MYLEVENDIRSWSSRDDSNIVNFLRSHVFDFYRSGLSDRCREFREQSDFDVSWPGTMNAMG